MFLIPFIIVLAVSIGASLFASKKENDFFLAGRSIPGRFFSGRL